MRNKTASGLIGGGVFLLAVAALTLTVIQPALLKAPRELSTSTTARSQATYLDPITQKQLTGTFTQKRNIGSHTVKANGKPKAIGNDSTAVYDSFTDSSFVAPNASAASDLGQALYTQAFNRSTGAGKPGFAGDTISVKAHVFKFPFNTQKKTYSFFDNESLKAFPMTFVGERKINGLKAYEYKQIVSPTNLGPVPVLKAVPGVLVGEPQTPSIPADQWIENLDKRVYVEPVSGSLVGGTSVAHFWAQTADGRKVDLLKLEGANFDTVSQAKLVKDAKKAKSSVLMLKRIPPITGVLGLLLLGLGILSLRRGRSAEAPVADRTDASGALHAPRAHTVVDREQTTN